MDKRLLGLVWGLPASFALPSAAAGYLTLAHIRPRLMQLQAADGARHHARSRSHLRF